MAGPGGDVEGGEQAAAASTAKSRPRKTGGVRGALAALAYGMMSVSSVFLNKAIFKVYRFKLPVMLVLGQNVFTVMTILLWRNTYGNPARFSMGHFKRVALLSALFLLKLMLDMSALSHINIPMYGVLKSSTTPFVMGLDWVMRRKVASRSVQASVWIITLGGFVAGCGDLTFDLVGYVLALLSALSTAAYVVVVGKLGDEMQLDSDMLLLYNSIWSLPLSAVACIATGEYRTLSGFPFLWDAGFQFSFLCSCASAFVLNLATYMCTLANDSLTTSVVGRTKSVVQGFIGLFAYGDVVLSPVNLGGLGMNSLGILWYTVEKVKESKEKAQQLQEQKQHQQDEEDAREGGAGTPVGKPRDGTQPVLSQALRSRDR